MKNKIFKLFGGNDTFNYIKNEIALKNKAIINKMKSDLITKSAKRKPLHLRARSSYEKRFSDEKDLPLVISLAFTLLSISTVVSQYIFTDLKPITNNKLLIYGTFLITISYILAALSTSIALFYLAMMVNGLGAGMFRPANASSLSLAQTPDNQGKAAGYLGSVMPIGHVLVPIIAMPIYQFQPEYLYLFSASLCFVSLLFIIGHPLLRDHEQTGTITN